MNLKNGKLPGKYKGERKKKTPPILVQIECPGCGWKGDVLQNLWSAEAQYLDHLLRTHYSILECAFCSEDVSRGLRCLPNFASLAAHVRSRHGDIVQKIEQERGYPIELGAIPPHAFKL